MVNTSKIFRITFRIVLLIITISLSLTSILGGLSAVSIFTGFDENIDIKIEDVSIAWDVPPAVSEENINMTLEIPFAINNIGYFPLEGLTIGIEMEIKFNSTLTRTVLSKTQSFDVVIQAEETYSSSFKAITADFSVNFDHLYILEPNFYIDVDIGAWYSFRMLHFSADLNNIEIPWVP